MKTADEAAEADALADLVNSLIQLAGDPERFHVRKDDIAKRLRRMARRLRDDRPEPPATRAARREAMARELAPANVRRRR